MKIEITQAYRNLRLLEAELSGRSQSQRRLELTWIVIWTMFIGSIFLCFGILIMCVKIPENKPQRNIAWEYTKVIKPIAKTIDEGWVTNDNENFAPIVGDFK